MNGNGRDGKFNFDFKPNGISFAFLSRKENCVKSKENCHRENITLDCKINGKLFI